MGLVRSMRAERVAIQEAAKAKAINTFLQDTLSAPNPYTGMGRNVTVLEALDNAVEKIMNRSATNPRSRRR